MAVLTLPDPLYEIAFDKYTSADLDDICVFLKALKISQICYTNNTLWPSRAPNSTKGLPAVLVRLYSETDLALFTIQFGQLSYRIISSRTYSNMC